MPRIAKDLGPFLLVTTEDTLSLVLETLSVVVEVDGSKWLTPELANSLVLAVLEVWAKNNKGRSYFLCYFFVLIFLAHLRCVRSHLPLDIYGHFRGLGIIVRTERLRNRSQTSLAHSLHFDRLSEA